LSVTRFIQHFRERTVRAPKKWTAARPFAMILTFHLVCIGWVLFRAENIQIAAQMLQAMFAFPLGSTTLMPYAYFCALLFIAMVLHDLVDFSAVFERRSFPVRALVILLTFLALSIFVTAKRVAFIYFQF
jgi:hypothetical protein